MPKHAFEGLHDVDIEEDVAQVLPDGTRLFADVYRPAAAGPHPVLLVRMPYDKRTVENMAYQHPCWYARRGYMVVVQDVRGRCRSEGDFYPFQHEEADGALAVEWAAALPGYTLAPDASLTEIVAEIRTALDWLGAHGPAHGINGPIVLSGWSAGGHLTAMCLDHPLVKAGLALSGIFELGPIRDTFLNDKLRLTDHEIAALSPMRRPSVNKPLAFAYGTAELPALIADSREMHAIRSAAHRPGALIPVPNANHFTVIHELRDHDGILTRYLPLLLP